MRQAADEKIRKVKEETDRLREEVERARLLGSRTDGDEGSSSVQLVNQEGREESGNPTGNATLFR